MVRNRRLIRIEARVDICNGESFLTFQHIDDRKSCGVGDGFQRSAQHFHIAYRPASFCSYTHICEVKLVG